MAKIKNEIHVYLFMLFLLIHIIETQEMSKDEKAFLRFAMFYLYDEVYITMLLKTCRVMMMCLRLSVCRTDYFGLSY